MLKPETITVLDPACGSGHILVEAYEVLKAIYLERGYRMRDIPRLILEKNLYGLDIDERGAQLAGFALLMKARADDRRLLDNPPKLNVLALQESKGLDADELTQALAAFVGWADAGSPTLPPGSLGFVNSAQPTPILNTVRAELVEAHVIRQLIDTFAHALTFGSLIQIPSGLNTQLPAMDAALQLAIQSGDLLAQAAALNLLPLVRQARILGMQFDAVVANPPYMGGKGMNAALKDYAKRTFPDSKSDLFAMFIERGFEWCKPTGFNSMVTMQSWMFLSSFQAMREKLLTHRTINTMAHLGARAFSEISREVVQTTAFVLQGQYFSGYKPVFFRLVDGQEEQKQMALSSGQNRFDTTAQDDFKKIPGSPVAYWIKPSTLLAFEKNLSLSSIADPKAGLATGDNTKFQRLWFEVSLDNIEFHCSDCLQSKALLAKWYPCHSGGNYRKWYGNHETVVNWQKDGREIRNFKHTDGRQKSRPQNTQYFFKQGLTWTKLSSTYFAARFRPSGFVFDDTGRSAFCDDKEYELPILAAINSVAGQYFLSILNPTLSFTSGDVGNIPINPDIKNLDTKVATRLIELHKIDWNAYETSWDFTENPLIRQKQITPAATISPVIPAGMQEPLDRVSESSHRDVNLSAGTPAQSSIRKGAALPSMALDSGIPAGMTAFSPVVYASRTITSDQCQPEKPVGWVNDSVTQHTKAPDVVLRDKAANPTYASISPVGYASRTITSDQCQAEKVRDAYPTLEASYRQWQKQNRAAIAEMQHLEEENNRLFIEAYGLQDELSPEVPEEQITLVRADRAKDCQRLISYAIGCMMGRYSLDKPDLIYAHAGNVGFYPDRYKVFPADADGIVPITDELWFEDDAANRIREFLLAVWNVETLDENMAWLAESLGQKGNETPIETIRRYLAGSFFKDHLQIYKKRPIYWLFSSGKQGAFQALVYLHRYHEGTLARMRAEYVVPLTGKIQSRIEMLEKDTAAAASNATQSKLNKDIEKLKKKHVELLAYDEKLRHYADLRIQLDLDDGVKVNYGKFGDLLAEVKAVTGGKDE